MKRLRTLLLGLISLAAPAWASEGVIDRLDEALTVSAFDDGLRARLSGTLDAEGYAFEGSAPGLIYTRGHRLFNPRLTLFLDTQLGARVYAFAQARADRGFDPGEGGPRLRLDECALRLTPSDDGIVSLQAGKFATLVGNWTPRHGSWENPFVTAPLPYENLTGIWDSVAARTVGTLLLWSHMRPNPFRGDEYADKHLRAPVIWGPSYATGAAAFGRVGKFTYAAEVKNASLSSRPETWDDGGEQWDHPTVSGRLGYGPNEMWNFGVSASSGSFLRPRAGPTLAAGYGRGDYREVVFGQDLSFAWHHLQVWAEAFEARFEIPRVGDVATFAYYAEAKYKFTPQFFGAVRWNQQTFSTLPDGAGGSVRWGRDLWRIDVAPGYRFTAHTQLKLQYSLQHEDHAARNLSQTVALQFTLRF
jgi:hypothetical protein